jgi:hypothetical protein
MSSHSEQDAAKFGAEHADTQHTKVSQAAAEAASSQCGTHSGEHCKDKAKHSDKSCQDRGKDNCPKEQCNK